MKSVRLRIAARLTLTVGLLSSLVGALVYCLICLPEVLNVPFDWRQLALVSAIAALTLIATAILLLAALSAEKRELAEEELVKMQALECNDASPEVPEEPQTEDCKNPRKPLLTKKQAAVTRVVLQVALPVLIACVGSAVLANRAKKKAAKKDRKKKEQALKALEELLKDQ